MNSLISFELVLGETLPTAQATLSTLNGFASRIGSLPQAAFEKTSELIEMLTKELDKSCEKVVGTYVARRLGKLGGMMKIVEQDDFADMLFEKALDKSRADFLYNLAKSTEGRGLYFLWKDYDLLRNIAEVPAKLNQEKGYVKTAVERITTEERTKYTKVRTLVGIMTVSQTVWKRMPPRPMLPMLTARPSARLARRSAMRRV